MIGSDGWLQSALVCPSPNFDARPTGTDISLLVLHHISLPPGHYGNGNISDFFCNQLDENRHEYFQTISSLQVSAHLLIDREGALTQFVSFADKAWHAGASEFDRRDRCNDFSIGIELEGCDIDPFTDLQYQRLSEVTRTLMAEYPAITLNRITGHSDISPRRKSDPGLCFDWHRFLSGLRED